MITESGSRQPARRVARDLAGCWSPAADLLADPAALRAAVDRYARWLGVDRPPIAAALAFKAYAWLLIEPAVTAWAAGRRVPDHSAAAVAVALHPGAFRLRRLTAPLPPTATAPPPAGDVPGAVAIAADELIGTAPAGLRAGAAPPDDRTDRLRHTLLDGHLAAAVDAFQQLRGGGSRPLWGTVAALLPVPAATADASLADRHASVRRLLALLPPPAAALVHVAELAEPSGWRPLLLRRTCCYAYAAPRLAACATCCLLSDAERGRLLAERGLRWRHRRELHELQDLRELGAARQRAGQPRSTGGQAAQLGPGCRPAGQ